MRLTKKQIEEIKEMREKGKTIAEIADAFDVAVLTVFYHLNPHYKIKLRDYARKRYKKMSREAKRRLFAKRKAYQSKYHRERYTNDPIFRSRQLESVRNNKRESERRLKHGKIRLEGFSSSVNINLNS